jgi:uncharacterized protein YpuA (DUF1002 family)
LKDLFKQNIIENIQYEYEGQFPKDFDLAENMLDNLQKLKLSSRDNKYMSLDRIKAMGEVVSESNVDEKHICKVILDINKELNTNRTDRQINNLENNVDNNLEL